MTGRTKTPRVERRKFPRYDIACPENCKTRGEASRLHRELVEAKARAVRAEALAERQSGTLADINDGLRAILNDNIEGMERERIEEIADNWKDMIARAELAEAELERCKKDAERYRWLRVNGDGGIYRITGWRGADMPPNLSLAQKEELDTIVDAALSAKSEQEK